MNAVTADPANTAADTTADTGTQADVLILGGGLAGLCLALQLKQADPQLSITVLERRTHPVAEAAFKVGESTVEIAAHYFSNVLGLREHLDTEQIRKFGFRFFFSDGVDALDRCTELGVSRMLPTPSWQIDRGRFENFLGQRARSLGIDFRDGHAVRQIEPGKGDAPHAVEFEHDGTRTRMQARWLVDAAGRVGLLKRKLGLARDNAHDVNAVWWRVENFVDPDDAGSDPDWRMRCDPPDRWRSTNHLCGRGYWLWMIPLGSNAHSIGIVADESMHPLKQLNSHDKASAWLQQHQPALARLLQRPQHQVKDFLFLRHFSYDCQQVFSADRWALTGEAGLFLDPFYSPGSDFIAISNSYITDLILRDRRGEPIAPWAALYQKLYDSFYSNTMGLYLQQYALFGDEQVLPLKVIWDYTYYWGLLAPLVISERHTDIGMLQKLQPQMEAAAALNAQMQPLLREWGQRNDAAQTPTGSAQPPRPMLDQYHIDWFRAMNQALHEPLDDASFATRIGENVRRMRGLAQEIARRAAAAHPDWDVQLAAELTDDALPAPLPPQW